MENRGIKPEPRGVCPGHCGGEVILLGVGDDSHGKEGAPLGKNVQLKVEDNRDERADVLDGGRLLP
jgi:hypothetical protein